MCHIIWVEDEQHTLTGYRDRLVNALQARGLSVEPVFAATRDDAWRKLCAKDAAWDVWILDLMLPDDEVDRRSEVVNIHAGIQLLEAYDAAAEQRRLPPRPATAVFTALANEDLEERIREQHIRKGLDLYLKKTLTIEKFEQQLVDFIGKALASPPASGGGQ